MRGRGVIYNGDLATRPMKDSIRETVFNILGHSVKESIAWDLFAGTGVLAIESLSRGAVQAIAIEKSITMAKQIRQSADSIGIGDELLLLTGDTFRIAIAKMTELAISKATNTKPWIVYFCPPYIMWLEDTERMFRLITESIELAPPGSQLVIETDKHFDTASLPLAPWDIRPKGNVTLGFFEKPFKNFITQPSIRGCIMKRALLVIDVQNEYFEGGALPISHPSDHFQNILEVMDAAHAAGVTTVVVRHHQPAPDSPLFCKGSKHWELHPEVAKRPYDLLLDKTLPGSFTGTQLETYLRERGIDTVTISGYMTQICCDTTARQAMHRGFKVEFLSDATGTLDLENRAGSIKANDLQKAILISQQMFISEVISKDEFLERLGVSSVASS